MLCRVSAAHTVPELMYAAPPVPRTAVVCAIAHGALHPHPPGSFQCAQHQPHACYQECICQIGACGALVVVVCAVLDAHGLFDNCGVLSTYYLWHSCYLHSVRRRCWQGSAHAVCSGCDVCSTFSIRSQLWFRVCQAISHLRRQHFTFRVCPVPVGFGICSVVRARTSMLGVLVPVV